MRRSGTAASWEGRLLGIITAGLAVFGVAAIYSASSVWAVQNGQSGGVFATRQLTGLAVGLLVMVVASRLDYRTWRSLAWPMLAVVSLMLLVPVLPFTHGIAPTINGARRWVDLGVMTVQPSEFAKFAVVAWTAMLAAKKGEQVRTFAKGLAPFLVVLVPVTGLVLLEPDLSTSVILVLLAGTVLFTAGARIGHFLVLALVALPLVWQQIAMVQFRLARMFSFLGVGPDGAEASWQIEQSLIGVGAGGFMGVGFGEGMQKLGYLPYAYSDFIFSTIGEEWGFVGVVVLVALFSVYVGLTLRIARTAPDLFGMLLATGIAAMIGVAAFLHVAVTLSLVPTTGITLPFIGYGRSSLLVSLFASGVVINIAASRKPTP